MTPQDQAPATHRVQCPFCLHTNELLTGSVDPLCLNCQLDLTRLVATPDGGVAVKARPEILAEPYEPRPVRAKKRKRRKKETPPLLVPAPSAAGTPSAQTFGVGQSLASPQFPPVTPPYETPVATPVAPVAPLAAATAVDERLEATVMHVASPRAVATWALEFETGEVVPLIGDDVVVGRHPEATGDAVAVSLPDPSRMLSRMHARLRRDASRDMWTIEDLGSINGVATVASDTGAITYATPGVPVDATEYLLIGTLRTRLRPADATHCERPTLRAVS